MRRRVTFLHVKGHQFHPWNDAADRVAAAQPSSSVFTDAAVALEAHLRAELAAERAARDATRQAGATREAQLSAELAAERAAATEARAALEAGAKSAAAAEGEVGRLRAVLERAREDL